MIIKGDNNQLLVVLEKDSLLMGSLTEIAIEHNLRGARISGIGAVKDVELGYYDLHKKEYIRKWFKDEDFELISLNGNVTLREGQHYVHIHTSLGRSDFSVLGGHLFEARVAVTAEIALQPLGVLPKREFSETLGLSTICGFEGRK